MYMCEFDYCVEYVCGRENVVADALSRYALDVEYCSLAKVNSPIISALQYDSLTSMFEIEDFEDIKNLFQNLQTYQL